jgi:hypothetical protein
MPTRSYRRGQTEAATVRERSRVRVWAASRLLYLLNEAGGFSEEISEYTG